MVTPQARSSTRELYASSYTWEGLTLPINPPIIAWRGMDTGELSPSRNMYPDGTILDKGCGTKRADKTFGDPVLVDVVVKP